ncbi:hypothetical protein VT03_11290 [Planctomyces sp. SH-PL14]|nr:hypothetical protein VT03_11290 [Planctomyces sp. SH-PL14]
MAASTVFGDGTLGFMSLNNSDPGTRPDGQDSHVMSDSSVGRAETPPDEVSSSIFDDLPSSTLASSEGRLGLNKVAESNTDVLDAAAVKAAAESSVHTLPLEPTAAAEETRTAGTGATGTGESGTGEFGESPETPGNPSPLANEPGEFSFPRPVFDTTVPIPLPEDGGLAALDIGVEPPFETEQEPPTVADAAVVEPAASEAEPAPPSDVPAVSAEASVADAAAEPVTAPEPAPMPGHEGEDPYATFVFPTATSSLTANELSTVSSPAPTAPPSELSPTGDVASGDASPTTPADEAAAEQQTLETLPAGFPLPLEEAAAFGAAALGVAAMTGAAPAADEATGDAPWHSSAASDSAFTSDSGPSTSRVPASRPAPKRDTLKIALISYAVLSTIAAGILFKRLMDKSVREDRLESLPDMPVLKAGQVKVMQQDVELNPGHRIRLGEKRRFGNIEVEPVRLTRGMVEYVNPVDPSLAPLPEGPVVKLWIRFRNVSQDQTIPVLDRYLVYTKQPIGLTPGYQTNNFIAKASDHRAFGYMLTHPHTDQNVLKGQELGHELAPGETLETFIPSTPVLDMPDEELLWRFHLRKGFSKSGRGVTTLIDVAFRPEEISEEGGAPQQSKPSGANRG